MLRRTLHVVAPAARRTRLIERKCEFRLPDDRSARPVRLPSRLEMLVHGAEPCSQLQLSQDLNLAYDAFCWQYTAVHDRRQIALHAGCRFVQSLRDFWKQVLIVCCSNAQSDTDPIPSSFRQPHRVHSPPASPRLAHITSSHFPILDLTICHSVSPSGPNLFEPTHSSSDKNAFRDPVRWVGLQNVLLSG